MFLLLWNKELLESFGCLPVALDLQLVASPLFLSSIHQRRSLVSAITHKTCASLGFPSQPNIAASEHLRGPKVALMT